MGLAERVCSLSAGEDPWPVDLDMVPHEAADVWADERVSIGEQLQLALETYRQMPCYGVLMYVKMNFSYFGPAERATLWTELRALLAEPEKPLVKPVEYLLWLDLFEDPGTADEAWHELTSRESGPEPA
jgi:hypothetical protein